jgi:predicted RNase H-like HicB family nuclease
MASSGAPPPRSTDGPIYGPTSLRKDLPICVATGDIPDEVADLLREAIDLYLESLRDEGLPLPKSSSTVDARVIEVSA